ncbi:MAG: DUF3854 domain-containing protein, partial [Tatlockia sp.]|nr:DUF3854 domain-containing protein [Tatlockia sp.]
MLTPKHQYELNNSGIDPDIAQLNFKSLEGSAFHERHHYSEKLERTNTGRLGSKYLYRSSHCEAGVLYCSGLDPLNNWQSMAWGASKPDHPREDYQKPGKFIKYEHPPLVETRTFFLRVSLSIWKKIAKRYKLALPENIIVDSNGEALGFWAWVLNNPKISITICEGAKKAACLLSAGFVAIALPGIYGGYRSKDSQGNKIDPYLIPDLRVIAQKERLISICYDHDLKPSTIRNVNIAISQLGRLFQASGCDVKVISLPGTEKGVDDFILARGVEAFEKLYDSALPLILWRTSLFNQLTYEPNKIVSTKYLGSIDVPNNAKLVAIKAPKGSGKTEAIAQLCQEAYQNGQAAIVLTYRQQLGKELARRFKLPYKTEVHQTPEGKLYGFSLCVDSAHSRSEVGFRGDSWGDALVIVDECESIVWHTLNSSTCTKNRLSILKELETLFTEALSNNSLGRVILADADLTDLSIDFVKGIAGEDDLQPYLVLSEYKNETGTEVFSYQSSAALYLKLKQELKSGGKHFVLTAGQKTGSKWGTQNLQKDLQKQFPEKKILVIDRDTVADPNHPGYGCIDNLNEVLLQYDLVICSPVIESGVSIDLYNRFAAVWSFSPGVVPTNNVRQSLFRLRDFKVPRHIYMSERGLPTSFIGNGAVSITALRAGEFKKAQANFNCLLNAGITVDESGSVESNAIALEIWLKMACRHNAGCHQYRKTILADLQAEGCRIIEVDSDLNKEDEKALSEAMSESRDELTLKEAQQVVLAEAPASQIEYEALKKKKSKTLEERHSEANYEIKTRYLAKPTVDIVLKDWDGWYPQLRLHYYLSVGNQYLSSRDAKKFADLATDGRSWIPDTNRALLSNKVKALKALGIDKLLTPGVDWTADSPEVQQIIEKALLCDKDIKLFLGVTVRANNSPMAIVQELLNQTVGFKLSQPPKGETQFIEKGIDSQGKRERVRIYNFIFPDDRGEVFDRWLLQDAGVSVRESVSSCEQMDHENPIDLYKGFRDPYFTDPSLQLRERSAAQESVSSCEQMDHEKTVSSCEQMDHENPIDLYKGFRDPYFTDPFPQVVQEEAPTTIEQVNLAIWGALRQLRDPGQKIIQTAIAQIVGVSQGCISQSKKILQTLIE